VGRTGVVQANARQHGASGSGIGLGLPALKSNRGYAPLQLIEQFIVSI